ncbi:MAG: thioredoxin-dependent thiol peroxidase [Thermus sp.]
MVDVGERAPDFALPDQEGRVHRLSEYKGRWVVLYFYPKDDTPGCTRQACGIRDAWQEIEQQEAVVLGVSPDPPDSHQRFKAKYGLPFTLLSDAEHAVAEAYGVWVEKTMYGKKRMGIERSTFVIAPDGTVRKALRRINPDTHADEVLAALRGTST